ncbi:hypothetical protein C8R43DRAFT_629611 [Mycena crocata]|nr:hypothetical protein C8R43DRAFT_629611 [Mycena crocata]
MKLRHPDSAPGRGWDGARVDLDLCLCQTVCLSHNEEVGSRRNLARKSMHNLSVSLDFFPHPASFELVKLACLSNRGYLVLKRYCGGVYASMTTANFRVEAFLSTAKSIIPSLPSPCRAFPIHARSVSLNCSPNCAHGPPRNPNERCSVLLSCHQGDGSLCWPGGGKGRMPRRYWTISWPLRWVELNE